MKTQVGSGKFDMLVNHVRFNKPEMQKVMKPGAKYITILRDPRTQLESVFGYFLLFKSMNLREADGFAKFVSNPYYYYNKCSSSYANYLRNPNLYDLGLQPNQQKNKTLVNLFIQRISRDFDLVLINEYYNESLLLLKKILCLSFEDILYIPKGIRSDKRRYTISNNARESINRWCWADALLYAHFNKTFWERVRDYGPSFQDDLRYFERKLKDTTLNCTIANKTHDDIKHRGSHYIMNPNGDKYCSLLTKSDSKFTGIIRARQTKKTKKN
ncbi:galactosylceramide sulfotransferase-like [Anneissia japonica]|uniref:galactosylceramide sulfotransferase-like n=1 Tax=Anneissia japonica TaxID=1529436 RepID=UPI001425BA39|nr:galactosylceramide sulfotransferase-like [Anneissia japonica]